MALLQRHGCLFIKEFVAVYERGSCDLTGYTQKTLASLYPASLKNKTSAIKACPFLNMIHNIYMLRLFT